MFISYLALFYSSLLKIYLYGSLIFLVSISLLIHYDEYIFFILTFFISFNGAQEPSSVIISFSNLKDLFLLDCFIWYKSLDLERQAIVISYWNCYFFYSVFTWENLNVAFLDLSLFLFSYFIYLSYGPLE